MNRKRSHGDRTKEKESAKGGPRDRDNGFEEFGGYMQAKMAKLNAQFNASEQAGSESHIFSGVTININGHVNPTNLRTIFLQNGGSYVPFPTSSTDFVVAENLSEATKRKYGPKCVRPQWVIESIAAGKKLDHRPYLLYNLNEENNQKTLMQVMDAFNAAQKNKLPVTKPAVIKTPAIVPTNNSSKSVPSLPQSTSTTTSYQTAGSSSSKAHAEEKRPAGPLVFKCWEDGFLEDFWSRSRLHQISSMKKIFQQFVARCRRSGSAHLLPELELYRHRVETERRSSMETWSSNAPVLFLIDMDCFFVSVGRLTRPHMVNKPVAVTHFGGGGSTDASTSNSDIACASYEARKRGVKNGMWVSKAKELCPDLQVIPYDFQAYERVSKIFFEIVLGLTTEVEPGSCDEMLVDVTSVLQKVPGSSPKHLAEFLRERIFMKTKCPASIGIGKNRLLAKLASKYAKPNGVHHVKDEDVPKFMLKQSVRDIPGIGWNLMDKLSAQHENITTCEDLQKLRVEELKTLFGAKTGETIYNACRGNDERKLSFDFERPKSISIDVNFGIRMSEKAHLEKFALNMAKALCVRAEEDGARGTKLGMTVLTQQKGAPEPRKLGGHGYCDKHSSSIQLLQPCRDPKEVYGKIMSMLNGISQPISSYRGLALQLTGLKFDFDQKGANKSIQQTLFSSVSRAHEKNAEAQQHKEQQQKSNPDASTIVNAVNERSGNYNNVERESDSGNSSSNNTRNAVVNVEQSSSSSSRQQEASSSSSTLSPEQIDMSVLASLPEDIAREVASFYGITTIGNSDTVRATTSNSIIDVRANNSASTAQEPVASTSRGPQAIISNNTLPQQPHTNNSEKDELNPFECMSQLDRSFLKALPKEIRQEVEINFVHMKHQKRVVSSVQEKPVTKPKPTKRVVVLPKPKPNSSSNKASGIPPPLPHTTAAQREPASSIVKDNDNGIVEQQEFNAGTSYRAVRKYPGEEESQVPFHRVNWWRFNGKDELPTDKPRQDGSNFVLVKKKEPPPLILLPALNQRTDLAGVRNVIRGGMKLMPNPSPEDVNPLLEYFKQLVVGRFLQQTVILLKFLKRLAESSETNTCWSKIFQHVISSTQHRCKNVFGCPVELDD